MSVTIIPKAPKAESQAKFQAVIDDPLSVVMIVFGEGPDAEAAIEIASARASLRTAVRRVVWVKDSSVLSTSQRQAYVRANKLAVSVGLNDKIATTLTKSRAKLKSFVEIAFTKAEAADL